MKLVHYPVDSLLARKVVVGRNRSYVFFVGERPFFLGFQKQILPEIRHFPILVLVIERDQVRQRMYLSIGARTQVSVQVRLQFIQEDEQFSFIKLSVRLQIRW